ncbi:MAG: magnesium-protoporphyrin IX monomethyl ester (oxidative) cyclase [Bacteroidetes bacterium]|nr:magnesium-protoporphyrin IX monomethyl ester (oxidative) cyclase [Bacteroidota bacterium]
MKTQTAPHLSEDLLTPRFYKTNIRKAAKTNLNENRDQFEAMLIEMQNDYNCNHFDRKAKLSTSHRLSPEQQIAYESYLVRSCVSEYSGFLLFKELSRKLKNSECLELSELFKLMARDEARHAGFINRALVAEGIEIDLPKLSHKRPATWFPLSWVLYSVYLSEKIGYWRYILSNKHLVNNPDNSFAPLFDYFEPWCQDENRHGDIFNMLISCWPQIKSGWRGNILSRFFLWSVFITHTLTVCELDGFYHVLGMDPIAFDKEVITRTNETARRAFPLVFELKESQYFGLRAKILDVYRKIRGQKSKPLSFLEIIKGFRYKAYFYSLLIRQLLQPMVESKGGIA